MVHRVLRTLAVVFFAIGVVSSLFLVDLFVKSSTRKAEVPIVRLADGEVERIERAITDDRCSAWEYLVHVCSLAAEHADRTKAGLDVVDLGAWPSWPIVYGPTELPSEKVCDVVFGRKGLGLAEKNVR